MDNQKSCGGRSMTKGIVLFGDTVEIKKSGYCSGHPEKNVSSTVRWRGKTITNSNEPCPIKGCGKPIGFDYQIVEKGGTRFALVTRSISNHGKLVELSNKLEKKQQKLDYFQFCVERDILLIKQQKLMSDGAGGIYESHSINVPIQCPNCGAKLGSAEVKLECAVPEENAPDLNWDELWTWLKKTSKETKTKAAVRLGYISWENCLKWVESHDIERLTELLHDFQAELEKMDIATELIEDSVGNLQNQVAYHAKNLQKRINIKRSRIVEAIRALAKAEAHRRMPL